MKKLSDEWLAQLPLTNIKSLKPVAGGDINDSYEVGRPVFSTRREATMPMTPGCQSLPQSRMTRSSRRSGSASSKIGRAHV